MKLKKIIIKKYSKEPELFKEIFLTHEFYPFKFWLMVENKLSSYAIDGIWISKNIFTFLSLKRIFEKATGKELCMDLGIYRLSFPWTTSILTHYFFNFTIPFLKLIALNQKLNKFITLEGFVAINSKLISERYKCLKSFYFPFVYFITFKSLEYSLK